MKSFLETAVLLTGCASAACWFASAMIRLPSIRSGIEEMERVTELSKRLQRMSTWNFWAAGLMGLTALSSVGIRLLAN